MYVRTWLDAFKLVGPISALALMLTGCLTSEHELLLPADARTPLPNTFYFVQTDAAGHIGSAGAKQGIKAVQLKNGKYVADIGDFTIAQIDPARTSFLVQRSGQPTLYSLIRLRSDLLDVLVIDGPDEFFTKALDKQGIQYRMVGKDFDFPNRDSLIKAAAAFDSVFSAVHGTTYRIASTSSEKLAMENEIQKVISEAAQPATAPPVAATTVRRDAAGFPMFDSGGYSNTVLLDEFYIGSTEHLKVGPIMVYFQEFVQELRRIDGCGGAIGDRSFAELTAKASVGFLQQYVEQSRESQAKSKGSFEDAFKQGAKDAARQYEVVPLADADAHLFFSRHSCSSPIARQIFGNLERWVASN